MLKRRILETFRGLAVALRFRGELEPHRWPLAGVLGASLLMTAFNLLKPWPLQWIVDEALAPPGEPRFSAPFVIWTGAAAAAVFTLAAALLEYWRSVQLAVVGHTVTRSLRFRVFGHLTRLSSDFHARHKSGDLMVRLMGDVPILRTMLVDSPTELLTRLLLILGTVGFLLWMAPLLTVAVLAILPALLAVTRWLTGRLTVAVRKQRRKEGALADFMHEAIAANEAIQSLGRSEHVVHRFARSNRRSARAGLKATRITARLSASVESLLGVGFALALALGALQVVDGVLSTGELLVFISYVRGLLKPVRSASRHAERIAKGTACGERLLAILDQRPTVTSPPGAPAAPPRPEVLALEGVHYTYPGGARALDDVSLTFRRGELTALVGASGAGKSTLAKLVARLDDPGRGRVTFDGADVRTLDLASVREAVGLTLQETALFGETIRENLLLGRPDATDEELLAACHLAGADEFLEDLPEGLDTELGAAGAGLSGGQRRRLSLARTILRDAPILIVDEPFAGLDARGVRRVAGSLEELCARDAEGARVVIVIAHDFLSLDTFDRVVFLDGGRVVAEGRHAELLASAPGYRDVIRQGRGGAA